MKKVDVKLRTCTVTDSISNKTTHPTANHMCSDDAAISWSAATGYHVVKISSGGVEQSTPASANGSYTFEDIAANHTVDVETAKNAYTVTTSIDNGTITQTANYEYGDDAAIRWSAATGYHVVKVSIDGGEQANPEAAGGSYNCEASAATHTAADIGRAHI